MAIDPRLLAILACPEDRGSLLYFEQDGFLYNPRLKRKYRLEGGIPVMLVEEAITLADAEHEALLVRAAKEQIEPNFR